MPKYADVTPASPPVGSKHITADPTLVVVVVTASMQSDIVTQIVARAKQLQLVVLDHAKLPLIQQEDDNVLTGVVGEYVDEYANERQSPYAALLFDNGKSGENRLQVSVLCGPNVRSQWRILSTGMMQSDESLMLSPTSAPRHSASVEPVLFEVGVVVFTDDQAVGDPTSGQTVGRPRVQRVCGYVAPDILCDVMLTRLAAFSYPLPE
jgi:hypothetical protein